MPDSHCGPGAVHWIEANFHDCIYTTKEAVSFGLGLTSIAVWILAQLPQLINNIKNESAEALSIWFLAQVGIALLALHDHMHTDTACKNVVLARLCPPYSGSWATHSTFWAALSKACSYLPPPS